MKLTLLLPVLLLSMPIHAAPKDDATAIALEKHATKEHDEHEDSAEFRIKHMQEKLKITPEQEKLWAKVKQVMLDDAKKMDALVTERMNRAKTMTAVEDLQSYGEIITAHSEAIKNLLPAFSDLYSSMSAEQKKEADDLFRSGEMKDKPSKHK